MNYVTLITSDDGGNGVAYAVGCACVCTSQTPERIELIFGERELTFRRHDVGQVHVNLFSALTVISPRWRKH